ncbi:MAG: hypothetical protein M3Q10_17050 [Chloroflexota bacterium]|nr:hypothetical protein [Chloroflexota bacterium]
MNPRSVPNEDEETTEVDDRPTAETLVAVEHDLYDALAVIVARTQLMRRRVGAGRVEPGEILDGLAAVERAAHRMATSVGRLADGGKPDPTRGHAQPTASQGDAPAEETARA